MNPVTQYILGWNAAATICLLLGMLFMAYEIFTPGMGMPAILGGILLTAAVLLRSDSLATALVTILLIAVPLIIAAVIVFRSFAKGALSRSPIVLKESINASSGPLTREDMNSLIGAEGVCITALRPAGNADFEGRRMDVVSEGAFIAKGAKVRIVGIDGVKIIVREA